MVRVAGGLVFLSVLPALAAAAESSGTIRVVAQDTAVMKPDQAELDLGVITDRKTAAAALADNEHKMEQVLAAPKKELGPDGELKTSALTVEPRYEESKAGSPTQRLLGYTVTNMLHVRVANVRIVGRLLDLALQAGANQVERVELTLKDREAAENQALRAASAKARARATAIAEGQGLRVGEVISVSEGERPEPTVLGNVNASKMERGSLIATEAGSIEVMATVTVVFALKAR